MSYKALNDKHRQSALVPFLRIANAIPGILVTFIVDREIQNLFGQTVVDAVQVGIIPRHWKPRTAEKMLRIGALGGLVVAGMSAPRQDLMWFTDEDDIVANEDRVRETTRLFGRVLANLLSHDMGHMRFGTAKCDSGSKDIEDLLAIPDLVSGALSEMSELLLGHDKTGSALYGKESLEKAQVIMNWLADGSEHTLKKVVISVVRVGGTLTTRAINFTAPICRPEFLWHEEARAVLCNRPKE
ncbi:MAG: hypothetical protein IMZ65_04315 [Planctomycetes bacterium]|nr:hypothetical protein [Planctomycetota bacterium]